jgi:pre-mRNA-splicing factor 18
MCLFSPQAPAKDKGRTAGGPPPPGSEPQNGDGAAAGEEDPLGAAFRQAAADLAAQRAESAQEPPDRIIVHLKRLVEEWEAETQARAEAQPAWAASMEGRNAISTMRLSKEHIKPLFRQLKRRECPSDIERALWCIVKAMRVRNYKEAGDLYVRVAIGNAPWPIGVTMVGIHERSGRERISATSTAHIMHDEQTRKYLQAVKRLITYAQRRYPSTPSLSLEYNAPAGGMSALPAPAQGGGDAAGGNSAPLLLLEAAMPSSYVNAADGSRQDGWRANDQDVRTWKSIMRGALTLQCIRQ